MNLQHLRYLAAFAEHRTLTDAAESQGVSQPAMSRALHELQEELRCSLFKRSGRRLELTSAGNAVLTAARRALAAVEDIQRVPTNHAKNILRIATSQSMAAGMSPILEQFFRNRPETQIQVLHAPHQDVMLEMLGRRDVDVAYGVATKPSQRLAFTATRPLEIVLASPIGTDLPDAITFHDLRELPMLGPPASEERWRLLDGPCEEIGFKPNIVLESADTTTFLSGIQSGIGSCVIWDVIAAQATGVEVRRFAPPRKLNVGFIHHPKPAAAVRSLLRLSKISSYERRTSAKN